MPRTPEHPSHFLLRLAGHDWVVAIRRGFLLTLPLVMVGAFALVLTHAPWPASWVENGGWQQICAHIGAASFGILALCLVITISHALAALREAKMRLDINPVAAAIVALMSFIVLILPSGNAIGAQLFGVQAVFPAILVALIGTELFIGLLRIRVLRLRPHSFNDADLLLPGVLQAIFPAILCIAAFVLMQQAFSLSGRPFSALLTQGVEALFAPLDSPLLRMLLFCLISQLLWFFGAHGNNILGNIEVRYLQAATDANAAAVAAGTPPLEIFTKPLLDVFVFMGGSGTGLALLIAIMLYWRGSHQFRLARLALVPGMFNISEILMFGLPVVLNPVYLIPFVLSPLLLVLSSWLATVSGFIPPIHQTLPWTTPPLLGGYLAMGTWRGIALQVFNLAIAVTVYGPFVRAARQQFNDMRQRQFRESLSKMEALATGTASNLLRLPDEVGGLARQLAQDLMPDVAEGRLYLLYQPQVNRAGRVIGVEALLRWNHALFGAIPPNIAVLVAEEAELICPLGDWIIEQAFIQHACWLAQGVDDVKMSINLSPTQLQDPGFAARLRDALERHRLQADGIEFEVTEGRVVAHDEATVQTMVDLGAMGFHLAMDDFGMGYSSLLYMRRFSIDAVKLDGSLTREVLSNRSCQEIIETVATLCRNKQLRLIAEYVETEAQRDLLDALGCHEYQGYLYSRPLAAEACRTYIDARNARADVA